MSGTRRKPLKIVPQFRGTEFGKKTEATAVRRGDRMGIWIELGVFLLVFAFGIHQLYDLKQERLKRERRQADAASETDDAKR